MSAKALDLNELPVTRRQLDSPPLQDIASVFQQKLTDNFAEVHAEVIDCPNLTKPPFNLAAEGLGGNPVILDIGGPAYLLPLVNREKIYDLRSIPKLVGDEKCFVMGAGAGPWPYAGRNCEGIINVVLNKDTILTPGTRIAKVDEQEKCKLEILPANEYRCCLLANFLSSRGEPDKVVKVLCKKRIGKLSFEESMRLALADSFPDKMIGMGGVFVVCQGKVKQHIMPDFSETPIRSDEQVDKWLKFYEMSAPLSAVGTLVSKDPGLDLRVRHFHSFGKTEGGHYHYDTTPEEIEYLAILTTANTLARVDPPAGGSSFGKD